MDLLKRMNDVVDYIEEHLTDDISYDKLAQLACCSTYHLQRMFPFITDVALSEYIRRRRLTQAAFELQSKDVKVIDIALKYGYDSPEAFSRAFKQQHSVLPNAVKEEGHTLKSYPRLTFHISIKGAVEMKFRIEQKNAFEVFGVSGTISIDPSKAFEEVAQFRLQCDEDHTVDEMNDLLGRFSNSMLHAALYDHNEINFKYMICYHKPKQIELSDKFTVLEVPAQTWAIFPVEKDDEFQTIFGRIYSEWFATSGFEQVKGPTFEMYYGVGNNNFMEIWIPIQKI